MKEEDVMLAQNTYRKEYFSQKINKSLKKGLEKCDKIIIGEYDPPLKILKHMKSVKLFILKTEPYSQEKN